MSEPLRLAIVGCGGMGHRHLYGLAELQRAGLSSFELVGACDLIQDNANSLADQAVEFFTKRPVVVSDLEALAGIEEITAVDICAAPRSHHTLASQAFHLGWQVMIEKPMGLTCRACNLMRRTARESGKILAVAENYRRDPINRLARALLDQGVIGQPRLLLHNLIGGRDQMLISVWRHQKNASGVLLDVGVHFADMMEYFLGPVATVYAQTRLHEPIRKNPAAGQENPKPTSPAGVYERWQKDMPAEFEATAEDAAYATLLFASGTVAQYIEDHGGHGQGLWKRTIYGSQGSLNLPGDRSGRRLQLTLDGQKPIDAKDLFDLIPDFHLDEATAKLFGGDRLFEYHLPFSVTDRKLLAIEYYDFSRAILTGQPPEVDGDQGARSVALCYAILESAVAHRVVTVDEVLEDQTNTYQESINRSLGL